MLLSPFGRFLFVALGVVMAGLMGKADGGTIPEAPREFRAVWVATVVNLDWPSKKGLSTADQKRELLEILDSAQAHRLNAVVFQARPACDALYDSKLEPWSEYLTGKQGQAPDPYYDPLEFAIEEAHKRGLELHVWLNTYRASLKPQTTHLAPNHIARRRPDLVRTYDKYLWMDPGHPDGHAHLLAIVRDIVDRYDIDGFHFDDYFYPYPVSGLEFPDDDLYQKYKSKGGNLNKSDWRRDNVNRMVKEVGEMVHSVDPHVKYGISPFGIWRPGHPQGIIGMDPYETLFADARLWIREGWVDYLAPQLYWGTRKKGQEYAKLLDWWIEQNPHGRHIWPGNGLYKINDEFDANDLVRQIEITRDREGATGNIHFRYRNLAANVDGISDKLKNEVYTLPALVPASPWLDDQPPERPDAHFMPARANARAALRWKMPNGEEVSRWVVYADLGDRWWVSVFPSHKRSLEIKEGAAIPVTMAVSAVDRTGNESPRAIVRVQNE